VIESDRESDGDWRVMERDGGKKEGRKRDREWVE
jgi:hypothetical protein